MENPEILVHISAPSGASDDARYRAQADAILGFQVVSRQNISLGTTDDAEQSDSSSKDILRPPVHTSSAEQRKDSNAPGGSPQKCPVNDSLDTPVSVIPDSQPERTYPEPKNLQYLHAQPRSPSAKRRRIGSPSSKDGHIPPALTLRPEQKDLQSSSLPNQQSAHLSLTNLPLEIHPPPSPISTEPFTTHLTPTLELLAKRLSLSRIYKPAHQSRDLDTLERGYWFICINILHQAPSTNPSTTQPQNKDKEKEKEAPSAPNNWDITLFTRFWAFLTDFISKDGRAGWGVWCILEESPTDVPTEQFGTSKSLTLKVYTWGEIASHIYLLLFLASERKIRKMGAQWRDCSEEVVVQM